MASHSKTQGDAWRESLSNFQQSLQQIFSHHFALLDQKLEEMVAENRRFTSTVRQEVRNTISYSPPLPEITSGDFTSNDDEVVYTPTWSPDYLKVTTIIGKEEGIYEQVSDSTREINNANAFHLSMFDFMGETKQIPDLKVFTIGEGEVEEKKGSIVGGSSDYVSNCGGDSSTSDSPESKEIDASPNPDPDPPDVYCTAHKVSFPVESSTIPSSTRSGEGIWTVSSIHFSTNTKDEAVDYDQVWPNPCMGHETPQGILSPIKSAFGLSLGPMSHLDNLEDDGTILGLQVSAQNSIDSFNESKERGEEKENNEKIGLINGEGSPDSMFISGDFDSMKKQLANNPQSGELGLRPDPEPPDVDVDVPPPQVGFVGKLITSPRSTETTEQTFWGLLRPSPKTVQETAHGKQRPIAAIYRLLPRSTPQQTTVDFFFIDQGNELMKEVTNTSYGGLTNRHAEGEGSEVGKPKAVQWEWLQLRQETARAIIFRNGAYDSSILGTLYQCLEIYTISIGRQFLRKWLCHPLKDTKENNHGLIVVEVFDDLKAELPSILNDSHMENATEWTCGEEFLEYMLYSGSYGSAKKQVVNSLESEEFGKLSVPEQPDWYFLRLQGCSPGEWFTIPSSTKRKEGIVPIKVFKSLAEEYDRELTFTKKSHVYVSQYLEKTDLNDLVRGWGALVDGNQYQNTLSRAEQEVLHSTRASYKFLGDNVEFVKLLVRAHVVTRMRVLKINGSPIGLGSLIGTREGDVNTSKPVPREIDMVSRGTEVVKGNDIGCIGRVSESRGVHFQVQESPQSEENASLKELNKVSKVVTMLIGLILVWGCHKVIKYLVGEDINGGSGLMKFLRMVVKLKLAAELNGVKTAQDGDDILMWSLADYSEHETKLLEWFQVAGTDIWVKNICLQGNLDESINWQNDGMGRLAENHWTLTLVLKREGDRKLDCKGSASRADVWGDVVTGLIQFLYFFYPP